MNYIQTYESFLDVQDLETKIQDRIKKRGE